MDPKHIRHYSVRLKNPISSAEWFPIAAYMEHDLNAKGFDTYEFRLVSSFDREWVIAQRELDSFEGHVGLPKSGRVDPEALRLAITNFLAQHEIEVKSVTLD